MKKIMYIAAALLVLVGCQKSQEAKENAPVNYGTITGKIELPQGPNKIAAPTGWASATDPFTMVWESTDKIYIYNQSGCKELTVKSIDEQTGIATFEGELLSDMSSYMVYYGYDPSKGMDEDIVVPYIEGNYRPFAVGMNTSAESFTIVMFLPVFGMPLKGTAALTKIEASFNVGMDYNVTMTFDETPLQLSSTPQTVYFPISTSFSDTPLTFKFYDAGGLIWTKTIDEATCNSNEVITFSPALEVNGTAPTTTPTLTDVLEYGATFEFGITPEENGPAAYDFAYKNQNGTFICTKVFRGGVDGTAYFAEYCPVLKDPSENLFTFILGDEDQNIIFNADNNSYAMSKRFVTDFKLTSFDYFKVNGVDITSTLINETVYE